MILLTNRWWSYGRVECMVSPPCWAGMQYRSLPNAETYTAALSRLANERWYLTWR